MNRQNGQPSSSPLGMASSRPKETTSGGGGGGTNSGSAIISRGYASAPALCYDSDSEVDDDDAGSIVSIYGPARAGGWRRRTRTRRVVRFADSDRVRYIAASESEQRRERRLLLHRARGQRDRLGSGGGDGSSDDDDDDDVVEEDGGCCAGGGGGGSSKSSRSLAQDDDDDGDDSSDDHEERRKEEEEMTGDDDDNVEDDDEPLEEEEEPLLTLEGGSTSLPLLFSSLREEAARGAEDDDRKVDRVFEALRMARSVESRRRRRTIMASKLLRFEAAAFREEVAEAMDAKGDAGGDNDGKDAANGGLLEDFPEGGRSLCKCRQGSVDDEVVDDNDANDNERRREDNKEEQEANKEEEQQQQQAQPPSHQTAIESSTSSSSFSSWPPRHHQSASSFSSSPQRLFSKSERVALYEFDKYRDFLACLGRAEREEEQQEEDEDWEEDYHFPNRSIAAAGRRPRSYSLDEVMMFTRTEEEDEEGTDVEEAEEGGAKPSERLEMLQLDLGRIRARMKDVAPPVATAASGVRPPVRCGGAAKGA